MALQKFLKPFGALQAAQFIFLFSLSFTAAQGGALPEGEENAAEGGCFASYFICYHMLLLNKVEYKNIPWLSRSPNLTPMKFIKKN